MWVQKDQANLQQCQAPDVRHRRWHSRIQWELGTKSNCSFMLQPVPAARGIWYKKSKAEQVWRWQNMCQPPEPPLQQVQACLAEEQSRKMEGHRARSACIFWGWEIKHTLNKPLNCVLLVPWKPSERHAQWQNFLRKALWAYILLDHDQISKDWLVKH